MIETNQSEAPAEVELRYLAKGMLDEKAHEETLRLSKSVQEVSLSDRAIQSIDLTPLSFCTNLMTLELRGNQLQSIDLTPLSSCINLEVLYLYSNRLQSLDLTPLSSCTKLLTLGFGTNQLQTIDLTPLSSCTKLQTLGLRENQLQTIDLTPLSFCTELQTLELDKNLLKRVDLTPLILCNNLDYFRIDRNPPHCVRWALDYDTMQLVAPVVAWGGASAGTSGTDRLSHADLDVLIRFVQGLSGGGERWKSHAVVQAILPGLGLTWLGLLDADPLAILTLLRNSDPIEAAAESIIGFLCEQIDAGGTTIGLDVDRMSEHRELSVRIPKVLELRKSEMDKVEVHIDPNGMTDLRALWLTAYGHNVLSATPLGTSCREEELTQTKHALAKLGFPLKVTHRGLAGGANMSETLRMYIWKRADLRESWRQIVVSLRGRP